MGMSPKQWFQKQFQEYNRNLNEYLTGKYGEGFIVKTAKDIENDFNKKN